MRALRARSVVSVAGTALIVALLAACGATDPVETTAEAPADKTAKNAPPAGGGDDFWTDIPVLTDASPAQEMASRQQEQITAQMGGEFRTVKFRYWTTASEVGTAADFYLFEMPAHGWTKVMAMDFNRPTSAMSSWVKRDGDVAANVSVGKDPKSDKVYISVMRAEGAA